MNSSVNKKTEINTSFELVVIGASLGGLIALQTIVEKLSETFSIPMAVVIHRQHTESSGLVHLIKKHTPHSVIEPEDKMKLEKGYIYIAPMGYHLLVNGSHFSLSMDEPVHHSRPSIDVLFDTAAFSKKRQLAGIILTGSGKDGIEGLRQVKLYGGYTIVQNPEMAECGILPKKVIEYTVPDLVLPLDGITEVLNRLST